MRPERRLARNPVAFPSRALLALALLACLGPGLRADDWPQWLGPRRDGVWRETGILDKFPKEGPKVRWRVKIGGGYAGPAVADGRVYVTDRVLAPGQKDPDNPFQRTRSAGKERVLCLNERDGKVLWKHEYDCTYRDISYPCGPRATPAVAGGKVYTLGAMGDLFCLNAKDGKVVWSKNFLEDYGARVPLWAFSASPLIDGDKLICLVGGKGSVVVAFHKDTGKELWKALSLDGAEIGYCPPMIYTAGGKRQLIIWHPEAVNGLDPETGKLYWSQPFNVRANLTVSTPRLAGDKLFVTCFYNGCRLYELTGGDRPAAKELYRGRGRGERPDQTDKLQAIMCTPFLEDGYIYGVCSYGQLRCLSLADGKRIWANLTATGAGREPVRWANAFLVAQGERFFLFNEKGDLIIARLSPKGYEEVDRAHLLDPTGQLGGGFTSARKVVWSHPAFANKSVYARNDWEIVCASLARE
jgi:outer membrane protein assembly factor BamB